MSKKPALPPLGDLQQQIDALKPAKPQERSVAGTSAAMQMGLDLLSGVLVGGLFGALLDYWLGTSPWLLIVLFFLGAVAGFRNMLRSIRRMEGSEDETNKL